MKEKEIKENKYPSYSFRLDPEIVLALEKLKQNKSWNSLFKDLINKYDQ